MRLVTAPALTIEGMAIERRSAESTLTLVVEKLVLNRGEAVALTGVSGCGKSTLLDVLAMVLWPDAIGRMTVRMPDERVRDITPILRGKCQSEAARLRAAAYGYVLQTGGLLPFLTVRQNAEVADPSGTHPPRAMGERIAGLADRLRIAPKLDVLPGALSVGERQRAAILRALAKGPTILLADEPTANLDPETGLAILQLLLDTATTSGAAVLVVSHDHALVRSAGLPEWRLSTSTCANGVQSRLVAPCEIGRPNAMRQRRTRP